MSTMTGHRRRGIERERMVRNRLQAEDWWTCRAAGSFGNADIVALRDGNRPRLIQVKSTIHLWDGFGPKARDDLKWEAQLAGAEAWLCWWPKGKRDPLWIRADEWPIR